MGAIFEPNSLAAALYGYGLNKSVTSRNSFLGVEPKKRKAFFSFHYDDIMRVNNVRNAWKIDHPDSALVRSFYDSSLWENKKFENDGTIKKLIREGVECTSAVCVLVGAQTWSRRWVKYEIARSVIDGKGLLAVHINSLKHHERRTSDNSGYNPLQLLGIYKSHAGQYQLYEKIAARNLYNQTEWQWHPYQDYTQSVSLPLYLNAPDPGYVMPLSRGAYEYDFVGGVGHSNIGSWIDTAAQRVGR